MTERTQTSRYATEVAKNLLALGAIEFNVESPYVWVSGIKSPVYCDNRKINSDVQVRNNILNFFIEHINSEYPDVEVIAGVATGGMPLGVLIADRLNLPFVYVRQAPKAHGLMRQVEGAYKKGQKVVLIEDHVSTGGSSLKAINGLIEAELELLSLVSIMSYGFDSALINFEENNVNNCSLCDLDAIVDVAKDQGRISEQEKESILRFRDNPKEWSNN